MACNITLGKPSFGRHFERVKRRDCIFAYYSIYWPWDGGKVGCNAASMLPGSILSFVFCGVPVLVLHQSGSAEALPKAPLLCILTKNMICRRLVQKPVVAVLQNWPASSHNSWLMC